MIVAKQEILDWLNEKWHQTVTSNLQNALGFSMKWFV